MTFLVLSRKADAVVWRSSVASWLYGVADRTAQKVRARRASRGIHEQAAAGLRPTAVRGYPEARELR